MNVLVALLFMGCGREEPDSGCGADGCGTSVYNPLQGVSEAAATICGEGYDNLGFAVTSAGDFNADGYEDVIIGSVNESSPEGTDIHEPEGHVSIFFGPLSDATRTDASVQIRKMERGDGTGSLLSHAGDTDGDGFSDVMMAVLYAEGDAGAVYLLLGAATGGTYALGQRTDFSVVYGAEPGQGLGQALTALGDINGDGNDDIALGSTFFGNQSGEVAVFLGPLLPQQDSDDRHSRLYSTQAGDRAGSEVAPVGDVNGDGYADLLIGAPQASAPLPGTGRVWLVHGPVTGDIALVDSVATIDGPHRDALAGRALSALGDLDADGTPEIGIGSGWADISAEQAGALYVLSGSIQGQLSLSDMEPILTGEQEHDVLGFRLLGGGDYTCDGQPDIVVSAPRWSRAEAGYGRVYLLDAPTRTVTGALIGAQAGDAFGIGLGAADIDGDGCREVLVGAPMWADGAGVPGRVYAFTLAQ
jgi:hypothetical protein